MASSTGLAVLATLCGFFDVSADLGIACRDTDILIIDGAVSERVPLDVAHGVMRTRSIFVHDRPTFQLRPVTPHGQTIVSWEALFEEARTRTRQGDHWKIVFVRADQSLLLMSCIPRQVMTKDQLAQTHRIYSGGRAP